MEPCVKNPAIADGGLPNVNTYNLIWIVGNGPERSSAYLKSRGVPGDGTDAGDEERSDGGLEAVERSGGVLESEERFQTADIRLHTRVVSEGHFQAPRAVLLSMQLYLYLFCFVFFYSISICTIKLSTSLLE